MRCVAALILILNGAIIYVVTSARLDGHIGAVLQFGISMMQLNFFLCWRHARTHLSFDNALKARARTIALLQEGNRPDLAKNVDRIISSVSKSRTFTDLVLVAAILGPAFWLVIGKGGPVRALILQVGFLLIDHCNHMSCFRWPLACELHALQIERE